MVLYVKRVIQTNMQVYILYFYKHFFGVNIITIQRVTGGFLLYCVPHKDSSIDQTKGENVPRYHFIHEIVYQQKVRVLRIWFRSTISLNLLLSVSYSGNFSSPDCSYPSVAGMLHTAGNYTWHSCQDTRGQCTLKTVKCEL